jgi:hypothetical protein
MHGNPFIYIQNINFSADSSCLVAASSKVLSRTPVSGVNPLLTDLQFGKKTFLSLLTRGQRAP